MTDWFLRIYQNLYKNQFISFIKDGCYGQGHMILSYNTHLTTCLCIVDIYSVLANNDISDGAETARINEIRAITCDATTSFIYFADKDSTSNNYVLRRVNIDIIL